MMEQYLKLSLHYFFISHPLIRHNTASTTDIVTKQNNKLIKVTDVAYDGNQLSTDADVTSSQTGWSVVTADKRDET
jgi:hypothetical protein